MVPFDVQTEVQELTPIEELEGKLSSQFAEDKLMRSVMQNDKKTVEDGKLIGEAINRGLSSFTPDIFFSQLVNNYRIAKQLYGERLIRLVAGFDPNYIEKNLSIPEFKKELLNNVRKHIQD